MPVYAVMVRKQIHQTYLVDAKNKTEAKRLAREQDESLDAIGFDEIYPQPQPVVVDCKLDM